MKTLGKKVLILTALFLALFASSCSTTGEFMPLSEDEIIIGTVQTTFTVGSSLPFMKNIKNAINTEAYIKLLEAAERKYSGNIDIRDIVWVTKHDSQKPTVSEIFATGKVIMIE